MLLEVSKYIKLIKLYIYIYNNNNNKNSLGITLDERKSRVYQIVHPMSLRRGKSDIKSDTNHYRPHKESIQSTREYLILHI